MSAPDLRAVFFDIDDTLYSTTHFAASARRQAIEAMVRHGLRLPVESALRELEEVIAEFSSNHEHHFDKLLVRISPGPTGGVNRAILIAAGVTAYHDAKFARLKPFPDVLPALRWLSRTNLIRGVITDGIEVKQAEKILRLGAYPYLTPRAIFISDQIGISKPNPKIFERALSDLGLHPGQAMYVGDHPLKDIDPAKAIGMHAVLATRGGRHSTEKGRAKPDFTISSFSQLLQIIRKRFKVPVSA